MPTSQLMCIVTPGYRGSAHQVADAGNEFDRLFRDVGCVHFAAFALLPPTPEGGQPALVLELAVDPGISPDGLLDRLVPHGLDTLLSVYECCLDIPLDSSRLVIEDRLRRFLRRQLRRADGGYVGARDRTVGQILAEGALYRAARDYLQTKGWQGKGRRDVARDVVDWATKQPEWEWAAAPPPRSFWRAPALNLPLRGLLLLASARAPMPGLPVPGLALLAVVLLALAVVAFTGVLALVPFALLIPWRTLLVSPQVFGPAEEWGCAAVGATCVVSAAALLCYYAMISTARLVTIAAFFMLLVGTVLAMAIAFVFVVLLLGGRLDAVVGFIGATAVLLRTGVLALVAFGALWLLIALVVTAAVLVAPPYLGTKGVVGIAAAGLAGLAWVIHVVLGWLVAYGDAGGVGLYPYLVGGSLAGLPALDVIVLLEFLAFTLIASVLTRIIKLPPFLLFDLARRLDRIDPSHTLQRGHQIHPSIVRCEAELAQGRVSHMFSLTEVRPNVRVKRWLLRYFLRLVTLVGHTIFTEGKLAHAEGIRFAHWYVIEGRRLLFCSNFDGDFGGYLDEFINGASEGINLFWRWTELRKRSRAAPDHPEVTADRCFPPTRAWIFRGCKHEQWFKTYARDSMLPHLYRFEAYRYSANDVQRATRFREALFGLRTPVNDDKLLRALES